MGTRDGQPLTLHPADLDPRAQRGHRHRAAEPAQGLGVPAEIQALDSLRPWKHRKGPVRPAALALRLERRRRAEHRTSERSASAARTATSTATRTVDALLAQAVHGAGRREARTKLYVEAQKLIMAGRGLAAALLARGRHRDPQPGAGRDHRPDGPHPDERRDEWK